MQRTHVHTLAPRKPNAQRTASRYEARCPKPLSRRAASIKTRGRTARCWRRAAPCCPPRGTTCPASPPGPAGKGTRKAKPQINWRTCADSLMAPALACQRAAPQGARLLPCQPCPACRRAPGHLCPLHLHLAAGGGVGQDAEGLGGHVAPQLLLVLADGLAGSRRSRLKPQQPGQAAAAPAAASGAGPPGCQAGRWQQSGAPAAPLGAPWQNARGWSRGPRAAP